MSGAESDAVGFGSSIGSNFGSSSRQMSGRPPGSMPDDEDYQDSMMAGRGAVVIRGSSHVHVGSNITMGQVKDLRQRRRPPPATPAMSALFMQHTVVSERQMLTASRYIGAAWRDVARRLRFLGSETDDFEYRADSLREISFRMLQAWREREARTATVERLVKALWDEAAYDAVVKLAEEAMAVD